MSQKLGERLERLIRLGQFTGPERPHVPKPFEYLCTHRDIAEGKGTNQKQGVIKKNLVGGRRDEGAG